MSAAQSAIEREITAQETRRRLIREYMDQSTMVPGTPVYQAHAARLETLAYEVAGLRRALGVVKRAEAARGALQGLRIDAANGLGAAARAAGQVRS